MAEWFLVLGFLKQIQLQPLIGKEQKREIPVTGNLSFIIN
jgi:hypothetical protein